jgi:oleate hydratase
MVPGFNQLHGIMRTVYNQFDSMVRPLHQWLLARGVKFQLNTTVQDLVLKSEDGESGLVEKILFIQDQTPGEISVGLNDFVIVTLGSMTAASSLGGNDTIAPIKEPGCSGKRSLKGDRNLAGLEPFLTTLKNPNGCHPRRR